MGKIKGGLPETHEWTCSYAKKGMKKGRTKGGFIIGKRKGWGGAGSILNKYEEEGLILSEIEEEGKMIGIFSVYNSLDKWNNIENSINRLGGEREGDSLIIGGDFNIRTGVQGGTGVGIIRMEM